MFHEDFGYNSMENPNHSHNLSNGKGKGNGREMQSVIS